MAHDHSAHAHEHAPSDHSGHDHSHGHHHHGIGGHHHGPTDTGDWRYGVGLAVNLLFVMVEFGAG